MPQLHITPDLLESAYTYLRTSKPFASWSLPDPDSLVFRVLGARDRFGHFRGRFRRSGDEEDYSEIAISAALVKSTDMLMATMAHEMIHLYQDETGTCSRGQHNTEFRRLAKRVCHIHGFNEEDF